MGPTPGSPFLASWSAGLCSLFPFATQPHQSVSVIFRDVLRVRESAWLDRRTPCPSWEIDGFPAFCLLWDRKDVGSPTHAGEIQAAVLPVPGLASHMTPVQRMGLASW